MPVCVKAAWMRCEIGHGAIIEPCSAVLWCLIMTKGSPKGSLVGGLYRPAKAKRHPKFLQGERPEMGEVCGPNFLSSVTFSGLFDHFTTAWGIRNTNQTCQNVDFRRTWNPCCWLFYHAVQTRACSVARWSSSSQKASQARSHSLSCLTQGLVTSKRVMAVPPIYVDRSPAGDHETSEDTDQESQDLVILEVQWAFSFGNTSS